MDQYFSLYSWLFWTIVKRTFNDDYEASFLGRQRERPRERARNSNPGFQIIIRRARNFTNLNPFVVGRRQRGLGREVGWWRVGWRTKVVGGCFAWRLVGWIVDRVRVLSKIWWSCFFGVRTVKSKMFRRVKRRKRWQTKRTISAGKKRGKEKKVVVKEWRLSLNRRYSI